MADGSPEDTMRGRGSDSRVRLWVLIDANRWALTGVLSALLFAVLVAAGASSALPLRAVMRSANATKYTFSSLVTALITGVTLVVTINQLVLSAELGPIGDQRSRMRNSMTFRADTDDILGETSPTEPSAFLGALVDASRERAETLRSRVDDAGDPSLRDAVDSYAEGLIDHAETVSDQLEDSEFGSYDVVQAALNYNYNWKIFRVRQIQRQHRDDLSSDEREAFDDLVQVLTMFGPAREHFKTLYFRWELVNLSRAIIYASLPALAVSLAGVLYLAPSSFPGATLGVDNVVWFVSAATTLSVLPFLVLVAYVLRIATIAKRTLAVGPFVLRESERSGEDE
jgi:hypothetical protein